MADYGKKKNDELIALCKERGLAHSGKKADLVKRLEDHDATNTSTKPAAAEDEIDWDDEPATEQAKDATTEASANAVAAGGIGEVANPLAVPNQVPAIDPSQTNDLTVIPPAENGAEEPPVAKEASPEKDYSTGLAERTLDEEIEKRKARARKFGMPEDSDEIKALERARRFGNADVLGSLNKVLPVGERKRGREGGQGGRDGKVEKSSRGRPGAGRRQGSERRERERASPAAGSGVKKEKSGGSWMSEQDRAAMEKRKARFAQA